MVRCWQKERFDRPKFAAIVQTLDHLISAPELLTIPAAQQLVIRHFHSFTIFLSVYHCINLYRVANYKQKLFSRLQILKYQTLLRHNPLLEVCLAKQKPKNINGGTRVFCSCRPIFVPLSFFRHICIAMPISPLVTPSPPPVCLCTHAHVCRSVEVCFSLRKRMFRGS